MADIGDAEKLFERFMELAEQAVSVGIYESAL
jgi:hypothetical protein